MPEILSNKSSKDYTYISRYAPFPYYYHNIDNKYIYGISSNLDNSTLYTLHIVKQGDTFDTLALQYYNNPTLFWIICSFNDIRNPFSELTVGQKLKIPSLSNIVFDMKGRTV